MKVILCRFFLIPAAALIFSFPIYSFAEAVDPNFEAVSPKIKNICQEAAKILPPANDQPHLSSVKDFAKCDAVNLYYGIHQPPDEVKARLCAYAHHDYATLTMIYANGKNVTRNWELAIHFACQAGFAPEEIEGRVTHLMTLRDQRSQKSDFDICDDVTSGFMMGVCASRKEQLSEAQRRLKMADLMNSWTAADKTAWPALKHAADNFFNAHSANEIDLSGTARVELEIEERAAMQEDFLTFLQNLAAGHFPTYTQEQAVKIDQQLNHLYQQIQKNKDFAVGTIDRAGIKKTQWLWLKYRAAWLHFAQVKYPQVDEKSWNAGLAEKRIQMLQDLAEPN